MAQQQQYGMQPQYGQQPQYGMQQGPPGVVAGQPQPGQPGQQMGWMQPPPPPPGCPPGMEYLCHLDQILVKQETSMMEILTGWEVKNKFKLLNSVGQQVYYAMEESETCMRICCGPQRGFVYHITDNMQQEIFRIRREFQCCKGCNCCPCESCYYFASVEDRNGTQNLIAEVRGPCCPCQNVCCTNDIEMPIFDMKTNSEMGKISKQWPGLLKEMFTDSDNFRVTFPVESDDMMLYEQKQNNQ
ncbi:hypothetical protein BaRGS_00023373 [Batillaria attramentaria]|uniref:Phospholipid scramblase n=1 Tax=Batillaria attramentaria TaxID=370345 RepID=A0ABD0KEF1_9CAEN